MDKPLDFVYDNKVRPVLDYTYDQTQVKVYPNGMTLEPLFKYERWGVSCIADGFADRNAIEDLPYTFSHVEDNTHIAPAKKTAYLSPEE